jgi:hypothetical protein
VVNLCGERWSRSLAFPLWENTLNAIDQRQGSIREEWRQSLNFSSKIQVLVPIRYGRKSSLRKNTYTMVFSNSVQELEYAFIVPFLSNENIDKDFKLFKDQVLRLSSNSYIFYI